jgi:hypothetical protein
VPSHRWDAAVAAVIAMLYPQPLRVTTIEERKSEEKENAPGHSKVTDAGWTVCHDAGHGRAGGPELSGLVHCPRANAGALETFRAEMWMDGWRLYLSIVKATGLGCARTQGAAAIASRWLPISLGDS